MSDDMVQCVKPVWMKVDRGDPLTVNQWLSYFVVGFALKAIRSFTRRCRETPKLRERCVEYVVRAGTSGSWNVTREAQELADFITGGKRS